MSEDENRRTGEHEDHENEVEAHHAGNRHIHGNDEPQSEHEGDDDVELHMRRAHNPRRAQ